MHFMWQSFSTGHLKIADFTGKYTRSQRCPRKFNFDTSNKHKVLRMPREVTVWHVQSRSCLFMSSAKFAPRHTLGMIPTRSEHAKSDLSQSTASSTATSNVTFPIIPHDPSLFHTNPTRHASPYRERLWLVAVATTRSREQELTPGPPELNENPSLRPQEKKDRTKCFKVHNKTHHKRKQQ